MKQLFCIALLGAIFYSCGEEGIGFNARKEVEVESPMTIPGPPINVSILDYNPDSVEKAISFDLSDVSESVEDLGDLVLNSMSYALTDIANSEEVDLELLQVIIELPGASDLVLLELTGTLENTSKKLITLTAAQHLSLENQLFNQKELNGRVIIDLAEVPDENGVELTFLAYFDATVKIRDL